MEKPKLIFMSDIPHAVRDVRAYYNPTTATMFIRYDKSRDSILDLPYRIIHEFIHYLISQFPEETTLHFIYDTVWNILFYLHEKNVHKIKKNLDPVEVVDYILTQVHYQLLK